MAEQKPSASDIEQLREDVGSLMRHLKILGREKQAEVRLNMMDFHIDRPNLTYSEPFYTHPCGHKMCLLAQVSQRALGSPRGEGQTTQTPPLLFSVHVCLMPGEFDAELKLPMKGHVTIQVSNIIIFLERYIICPQGKSLKFQDI